VNALLEKYGFSPAGEILIDGNGKVNFKITADQFKQRVPQVYAWVVDGEIKYIGKAGKGIQKRFTEHRGGWRGGSVTGVRKAEYLSEALNSARVVVYGRDCDYFKQEVELFGGSREVEISMIDLEETYLITELQPEWNVAGK